VLSTAHRIVRWCTGQCTFRCPVRLAVGLTPQATVGTQAFYTGHSGCHIGQSGGLFSTVPPRTNCWGYCSWCTGQSGAPDQKVRKQHFFVSWTSLDLHSVFFWGVAFLNALVQVTLVSYGLQIQTQQKTLVHRLCWSSNTKTYWAKWPRVHFSYNSDTC
jgi:hypothetical protein